MHLKNINAGCCLSMEKLVAKAKADKVEALGGGGGGGGGAGGSLRQFVFGSLAMKCGKWGVGFSSAEQVGTTTRMEVGLN